MPKKTFFKIVKLFPKAVKHPKRNLILKISALAQDEFLV